MKFTIEKNLKARVISPNIGNVYNVRGGTGAKYGHMMVIVSVTNEMCTVLSITKDGEIVTGSNYGSHYFDDKCPIAYCAGLEDLNFEIQSL